MTSPYSRKPKRRWHEITDELLSEFPIAPDELSDIVEASWADIFNSRIGRGGFQIGRNIHPQPQMMGFLLHELIALQLTTTAVGWRRGLASHERDVEYDPEPFYSFEIKTSSSDAGIFGNRSYAQEGSGRKKSHSGFMLAVNFEKFSTDFGQPNLKLIRLGWLDASDWIAQRAATGQQARLTPEARAYKLRTIRSYV